MKIKKLNNEKGLVSIIVTMVIMSILTLVALGLANLATREQQQALDQQLNTQAFYAAESGVNHAVEFSLDGDHCTDPRVLGADDTVAASCVLIDKEPESLEYDDVLTNQSTVIPIQSNTEMKSLIISWEDSSGGSNFATDCDHYLLNAADWGNRTGMMRAMLIPRDRTARNDLIAQTQVALLYPTSGTSGCDSIADYPEKGGYLDGACDADKTPRKCSVTINMQTVVDRNRPFALRLRSIYNPTNVTITGVDGSDSVITFVNSQMHVDSTGRANDLLRRIRVALPINNLVQRDDDYPEFTVETSDSLCKRFLTYSGRTQVATDGPSSIDECQIP